MEREADLPPPRPVQRGELGQNSEGEQPQKIGDFLRHARAALRRPQPSGEEHFSLERFSSYVLDPMLLFFSF